MGGTLIQVNPGRPAFTPQAADPFLKIWLPGNLWASSRACTLIERGAHQEQQGPRPPHGEVFIRQTEAGARYICVSTKVLTPERRVDFRWATDRKSLGARHLEQVFQDAGLEMVKRMVYLMNCEEAEDAEYGACVAALWSAAEAKPIPLRRRSAAAERPNDGQAP